jgi:drug/metabolite transporter (DMT)-like permease
MPVAGEDVPSFSWVWLVAAVGLGAASCLIQLTMNWAQRSVSPTRATVIYAGEPVWGGIVGRLAGDRLPGLAIVGAVLIVAGVLVSEIEPPPRKHPVTVPSPADATEPREQRITTP